MVSRHYVFTLFIFLSTFKTDCDQLVTEVVLYGMPLQVFTLRRARCSCISNFPPVSTHEYVWLCSFGCNTVTCIGDFFTVQSTAPQSYSHSTAANTLLHVTACEH